MPGLCRQSARAAPYSVSTKRLLCLPYLSIHHPRCISYVPMHAPQMFPTECIQQTPVLPTKTPIHVARAARRQASAPPPPRSIPTHHPPHLSHASVITSRISPVARCFGSFIRPALPSDLPSARNQVAPLLLKMGQLCLPLRIVSDHPIVNTASTSKYTAFTRTSTCAGQSLVGGCRAAALASGAQRRLSSLQAV